MGTFASYPTWSEGEDLTSFTSVHFSGGKRYRQDVTLPFELKFSMPETDRGKRGYSDKYADKLARQLI